MKCEPGRVCENITRKQAAFGKTNAMDVIVTPNKILNRKNIN